MTQALYVGLDVHKDTIAVALAEEGRRGEVRILGTIAHKADSVLRLSKRLSAASKTPSFCHEAGPCGCGLHCHLTKLRFECAVVAPALIPRKAGDRVKTHRRDAEMLARLWRAGELSPIWTPDEEQEAMRDLIRTRKQADAGGSRVVLSSPTQGRKSLSEALRTLAPGDQGYRLESADQAMQAIPPPLECRQTATTRARSRRAGTGRLHLGHRAQDANSSVRLGAYIPRLTDARQAAASGPAPLNGTSARATPARSGIMCGKGFHIGE